MSYLLCGLVGKPRDSTAWDEALVRNCPVWLKDVLVDSSSSIQLACRLQKRTLYLILTRQREGASLGQLLLANKAGHSVGWICLESTSNPFSVYHFFRCKGRTQSFSRHGTL